MDRRSPGTRFHGWRGRRVRARACHGRYGDTSWQHRAVRRTDTRPPHLSPRPGAPARLRSGDELVRVKRRPRLVGRKVAIVLENRERLIPIRLRTPADATLRI